MSVTLDIALQRAKNLRNAKRGFQTAIVYMCEQLLQHGNAAAVDHIFRAAELFINGPDGLHRTKTGAHVWKYMQEPTKDGGLGLSGIVRWDPDAGTFKMRSKWKENKDKLDMEALANNLHNVLWYTFQSVPVSKAFRFEGELLATVRRAKRHGISDETIAETLRAIARENHAPTTLDSTAVIPSTAPTEPARVTIN